MILNYFVMSALLIWLGLQDHRPFDVSFFSSFDSPFSRTNSWEGAKMGQEFTALFRNTNTYSLKNKTKKTMLNKHWELNVLESIKRNPKNSTCSKDLPKRQLLDSECPRSLVFVFLSWLCRSLTSQQGSRNGSITYKHNTLHGRVSYSETFMQ